MKTTAIILAGGFSKRMGADKGLIPFNGKPLIQRSLEIVSDVADKVFIIANTDGYEEFGYPVYKDLVKGKGPIGGIHAGLTHSETELNLVLACDMPLLNTHCLEFLIAQSNGKHHIVVPRHDDQIEPLCSVYHRNSLPLIEKALETSDLSLHTFIDQNNTKFVEIDKALPFYSPYLFSNVNTIQELEKLESLE